MLKLLEDRTGCSQFLLVSAEVNERLESQITEMKGHSSPSLALCSLRVEALLKSDDLETDRTLKI